MTNAKLEYCIDGYNVIEEKIDSFKFLEKRLQEIKNEAASIIKGIFSVDIVIKGSGRMSIALSDNCILTYTSDNLEDMQTSLGDESAQGETLYYFGGYSNLSNKYIISYKEALDVLNQWIQHGTISNRINWTKNLY